MRSQMLAEEKIGRLLLRLSAPAMVGMLVQAFYNLVDTIFVGHYVGILAIAGITIVFPIQMIIMAVSQTIGIGGASIISRSLGAKEPEKAGRVVGNIFSLIIFASSIITILGLFFLNPLLKTFGAMPEFYSYAQDYLKIILMGTIFFAFAMGSNNIIRAEGNARVPMVTMLISAALNIVLDAIFIIFLNMGVKGAALATVLAQGITGVYLFFYFVRGKSQIPLKKKYLIFEKMIVLEIFAVGASAFVRQAAGSLMTVIINKTLVFYGGGLSIAIFGAVNRLLMFVFMPMFGIVQGLQPIVGFNYGAKNHARVREAVNLAIIVSSIISVVGFLLLLIFPEFFMAIFGKDEDLIKNGVKALRIMILALPLVGFQVVGSSMYQALGKALPSLILTMTRQIIFLIPLVLVLPLFYQLEGVWIAFPSADLLSALVTFVMIMREFKILKKA